MIPKKRSATHDRIARLYKERRMTCREIGERVGLTTGQVARVVKARGLTRPNGWNAKPNAANKVRNDRIVRLYMKEGLTARQVADRIGTLTQTGVLIVLRGRGVKRRQPGSWSPPRPKDYYEIRAYAKMIAPHIGEGPGSTTVDYAKAAGIPAERLRAHLRALGGARRPGRRSKISFVDATRIKALLVKGEMSFQQIADLYGIGSSTVWAISMGKSWVDAPWPGGKVYVPKRAGAGKVRLNFDSHRDAPRFKGALARRWPGSRARSKHT